MSVRLVEARRLDSLVVREVGAEEGFEKLAVVRDFQVKQLVDDDVFAEIGGLGEDLGAEGHRAARRAGSPLAAHPLHADLARLDTDAVGPAGDLGAESGEGGGCLHRWLFSQSD